MAIRGFDVVLNPPWERVEMQEQEFFAGIRRHRHGLQEAEG
jgi:hypothetical protein